MVRDCIKCGREMPILHARAFPLCRMRWENRKKDGVSTRSPGCLDFFRHWEFKTHVGKISLVGSELEKIYLDEWLELGCP